jgi:hypothetical protein
MDYAGEKKRSRYLRRHAALVNERSSWMVHWREISDYLMPRQGRFFITDRNVGKKRHNNILDNTATRSLNRLAAGLMAGMTSPARPWFRLATNDPGMNESDAVKQWLDDTAGLMREIFARSNTYRALHSLYKELGGFGTAANIMLGDFENVIHMHPLTVGEYCIGTDHRGQVDTLYRQFDMTVAQMVKDFGRDKVSPRVADAYRNGNLDHWVTVVHVIDPRADRDYTKRDAANMAWASCYFELASDDEDRLLRESGFKRFPGLAPRWDTAGGDIYGNSPGMEALGDIRQLQHQQFKKSKAIDFQADPPVVLPLAMKGFEHDLLPGGHSYVDTTSSGQGVRSAFDVPLRLDHLLADIQDVRERIRSTFYEDLFMMIANDQRSGITAREIAERHEEKLIMLGPVLERLHNEMLSPLIDSTFDFMIAGHMLPPPPKEMQGMDLNVEFVSMLAQAQRAVGIGAIDRLIGTVGSMAQFKPDVLDKLDGDQIVDKYSDMLGVDPDLIVADDKVAIIRQQRARQAAAQEAMAAASQASQSVAALARAGGSGAGPGESGGMTDLINQFSGYSIPTGGMQ